MRSDGRRARATLGAFAGAGAAAALAAALLPGAASAKNAKTAVTTVEVTLGKTSSSSVQLAPAKAAAGKVRFEVKNAGSMPYRFMVCTKAPSAAAMKKAECTGRTTKLLRPGRSTSFTIELTTGRYEYLVTTTPNAMTPAKAIKGRISVTKTKAEKPSKKKAAPKPKSSGASSATLAAGEKIFKAKCGTCHTLAAAHTHGGVGPNLDQLAPSQATVASQVKSGGTFMPSFATVLSSKQIDEVAAFVYHSTHK